MTDQSVNTLNRISPRTLLRTESWAELHDFYELRIKNGFVLNSFDQLVRGIALIHCGKSDEGLNCFSSETLASNNARNLMRRYLVSKLAASGQAILSGEVIKRMLDAGICAPDDVLVAASSMGKARLYEEAFALVDRVWFAEVVDERLIFARLRTLVQSGRLDAALALAREQVLRTEDPAFIRLCISTLSRSECQDDRMLAASKSESVVPETAEHAATNVSVLRAAGRVTEAIEAGERALSNGLDCANLRSALGQSWKDSERNAEAKFKVVEHFAQALAFSPENLRVATFYAEALIRVGRCVEAIPLLEKWLAHKPDMPHARALYARALKQTGNYDAASEQFQALATQQASGSQWNRYAAAALLQAGLRDDAEALFEKYLDFRREKLPDSFEEGLALLEERVDSLAIPAVRLDWAWSVGGKSLGLDRQVWERRAKWGYLADHFLLDWLECRSDQADEVMERLADLGRLERFFADIRLDVRGCIIATAHMGAMYAGPMVMSLLGIEGKWLASTPSVLKSGHANSLISTSDQSDAEVVRACMQTLREGRSIAVAVDGAINLAAPTTGFLGQQVTYSSFCARLAYKLCVPSVFCVPLWRGGRIDFFVERMVDPDPRETIEAFGERWKAQYLQFIKHILSDEPENLRLAGGIWRQIVN